MQIKKNVYFGLKDPLITLNGNKGQRWVFLTIPIPKEKVLGAFQIVIEARRGTSYLSDIDLAYVELTSNDTNKCHRLIMATKSEIDLFTKLVQLTHVHDFISCRYYICGILQDVSCEGACGHAHVRCAVARVRVRAKRH